MEKISILGTGNMATALSNLFSSAGHELVLGSRNPEKKDKLRKDISKTAKIVSLSDAANFGDIIILAVPWTGVDSVISEVNDKLDGKIVIDITNPLKEDYSGLQIGFETSAAEEIAKKLPNAFVIKAFNTIFAQILSQGNEKLRHIPIMFAGDNEESKKTFNNILVNMGLKPLDVGSLKTASYLEPTAMLGIHLAYGKCMGPENSFVFANVN